MGRSGKQTGVSSALHFKNCASSKGQGEGEKVVKYVV